MPRAKFVAQLTSYSMHTHVQDERGLWPDHEFLIPGEGEMDYLRSLKAMKAAGFDDQIVVEISIMLQKRPDFNPPPPPASAKSSTPP